MSDQIILKSVGSYVDVDDEWVDQLSEEDCRSFLSVVLYRNKPLSA